MELPLKDLSNLSVTVAEADRQNMSNRKIGEMRAPNISRDKGFFLNSILV